MYFSYKAAVANFFDYADHLLCENYFEGH